ncbi:hypothetical protein N7476_008468 [Penicillium atrosanguineum]|uniref:Uncharacterized protein n=1 Tax=Penicillium atrosanguineum TaxID=1132637 RepID=A0A9W9PRN7_9EURO|nr:hypothetical protein N7476_008468 [Penicillium atrosanguineum]
MPQSFDYPSIQPRPFSLPMAYVSPQAPSTPQARPLPLFHPHPVAPPPSQMTWGSSSKSPMRPLTPSLNQLSITKTSNERTSGRISRPLIPTVEPFQPASSRVTLEVEMMAVRSNQAMKSQTSGSPIPHAGRKVSRPLSAHVAPFEPSSYHVPLGTIVSPAEESEVLSFKNTTERSAEPPEDRSFTTFLEGDRLEKEATSHFSNLQLRESARDIVRVKQLESGCRQYLFSPQSNVPTPGHRVEQRVSPERNRRLESVSEDTELTDPVPVYHAHQEMINPTFASQCPTCPGYGHSNPYGHFTPNPRREPAMIQESDSYSPRLTTQEIEVLTRAAERQARLWLEAERIEKDRIEMEDEMMKKRAIVQLSLEARQDSRLEREGYDYTRPEVLVRDHQRRDESAARAAESQLEYDARIWRTFYPFWGQQPPCPRFPEAHTRASNHNIQELVTMFEVVFCNMAGYRYGYINYRPLHVAPPSTLSQMSELPRHRPSWIPGPAPTQTDWEDPSICDNTDACRNIRENSCFVPYMEPTGMHRPPISRDPCIEPLIGQDTLPHIPPFIPDFPGQSLQESAWLRGISLRPHQPPPSAQSNFNQARNSTSSTWSASVRTSVNPPRFTFDPSHAPVSMMARSQALYPAPESPKSYNSPSPRISRSQKIHRQIPQSPNSYRNTPSSQRARRQTIYPVLHSPKFYNDNSSPSTRNKHTYRQGPQSPNSIDTTPSSLKRRRRPRKK